MNPENTANYDDQKSVCASCGAEFEVGAIYWRRFCNDKCRQAFHRKASQIGREVLRRESSDLQQKIVHPQEFPATEIVNGDEEGEAR